ncbi:MAG: hypothetical protein AAF515_00970 [Pseudomonadota bacterium]
MNVLSFRFRGRVQRLMSLYRLFHSQPKTGLHPAQVARETGMSILDVDERLKRTPELFVRLPKRAGAVTRYRLTSAITAQSEDEVLAYLQRMAQRESLILYGAMVGVLLLFAIMMILMGPAV